MQKDRFEIVDSNTKESVAKFDWQNEAVAEACFLIRAGKHSSVDVVDHEKNTFQQFRKAQ